MQLRILRCPDRLMWYAGLVSQVVGLVREDADGFWAREPAGFLNIIHKDDAEVLP
jgi:hypothetical protein